MERLLATAPVRALSGTLTEAYSVGQRLKRGSKRKIEYGYLVHVAARESSADAGRITVLWMRGASLAPENAVVTCEGNDDMERLQNWANNYEVVCTMAHHGFGSNPSWAIGSQSICHARYHCDPLGGPVDSLSPVYQPTPHTPVVTRRLRP